MKEIGIFLKDATDLDRGYMQYLTDTYTDLEAIREKLLEGMRLVERDSENGEMVDI
jgi:hypothetical protein